MPRREDSLDVEVAASGYTKDMQADDELLHPAGPDDGDAEAEGDSDSSPSDEEESEKRKVCRSEIGSKQSSVDEPSGHCRRSSGEFEQIQEDSLSGDSAGASAFEMAGVSQALEEIEGQVAESSSVPEFPGEKDRTETGAVWDGQAAPGGVPAGPDECDDHCPDLIPLSSLNKEFRPFRYVVVID